MKLVIAEKPSVGRSIAKVIGAKNKKEGYYEGNGYIVSWCIGHLVQMANPETYDEKYKKWRIEDLPIIPKEYKYEVSKSSKKQFNILKRLMSMKEVDTVINACDAGREGEAIFRLLYNQANCKKNMKRLWISSMEDSAIEEGFNNLKDGKAYDNLYDSAQARAIADWLVGMNMSRLYSLLYNENYSVGRVQTPTLNMIVERDFEIENFKKEKYYTVKIETKDFSLVSNPIKEKSIADQLKNLVPDEITIKKVEEKIKRKKPELLYDLTTLQRECNKYYGYSAKQTLDYLQSLYEKKFVTYPRTDSRVLTEDMKDLVMEVLKKIDPSLEVDFKNYLKIFDNKKVSDHHAILPTISSLKSDISEIPESERKVYELVKKKLIMACSKDLIEKTQKLTYQFEQFTFTNMVKTTIQKGFKEYLLDLKREEEKELPSVKEGDVFTIKSRKLEEKFTQPKKYYTEDTLLRAMETAGVEELDGDIEIERKGLGTPATIAGIIESLIQKKYIERKDKKLVSTKKGWNLTSVMIEEFKTPKTTAQWELKLSDIANNKLKKEEFILQITDTIRQVSEKYKHTIK